ncbi:MAG: dihydrolipoamide acetyltransferase family protein, partial [Alphaproteobacteria bacterium]|nr:dihydrolipoamide acetyltransferase family protein [Alphaproteobacteria bacterium]
AAVPASAPATNSQTDAPVAASDSATSPEQPAVAPVPTARSDRVFASPLARRIAADAGLELARLSGTGPHGRIIRADVEEALASGASGSAVQPAAVLRTASPAVPAEERFVPHNAMRRVIADRLQQSKQTAPHFYLSVDCDIDNLLAARKALNEAAEASVKISVNDMVVKATAVALMAEPDVNGCFEAEGCRYYSTADICVAVAVDGGLVTPVIYDVQNLGLADISRKTTDLASRARAGTLDPSEYAGGSFTISNLGMFGIREFAAVINPPQSAILAVGAGEQRPVVKNGELAVATVMTVTLSADHRIVDGALGAKWLQAFKRAIEQPVTMLL